MEETNSPGIGQEGRSTEMPRIIGYCCNGYGSGHLSRMAGLMRSIRGLGDKTPDPLDYVILTEADSLWPALQFHLPMIKLPSKATLSAGGCEIDKSKSTVAGVSRAIISTLKPDILIVDTFLRGTYDEFVDGSVLMSAYVVFLNRERKPESAASLVERSLLPNVNHVVVPHSAGDVCVIPTAKDRTDWSGPIMVMARHEQMSRAQARTVLGLSPDDVAILFYPGGGSSGSELPGRVAAALHQIEPLAKLFLLGGSAGDGYESLRHYPAMEVMPAFDAAIAAAGYNTVHELLASGVPSAFFPRLTMHDDQAARIRRYAGLGACIAIEDFQPDTLREVFQSLLRDEAHRARLAQCSCEAVPDGGAKRAAQQILGRWRNR